MLRSRDLQSRRYSWILNPAPALGRARLRMTFLAICNSPLLKGVDAQQTGYLCLGQTGFLLFLDKKKQKSRLAPDFGKLVKPL